MTSLGTRGRRDARRLRDAAALALAVSLVVAACGTESVTSPGLNGTPGSESSAPSAPSGPTTDTSVLVAAVSSLGTQNFAPWLSSAENYIITTHVGDQLVMQDPVTGELKPGLAESWSLSDDLTTWTFKLRPGVPFHDGWGTVTSEDVKFSWEMHIREESAHSITNRPMRFAVDENMDNFEIVNDLEFRVRTTTPVVNLDLVMANLIPGMVVQSKAYFEAEPEQALVHPLGTGPFKFVSSTQGVEVILEATESHPFRPVSAFTQLIIRAIEDDAARLAQAQTGDIDIALIGANLVGEAQSAGLEIIAAPEIGNCSLTLGGYYPGTPALDEDSPWIQATEPAKGKAIREAMSLAIDRQAVLDRIMGGYGALSHGPIINYPDNPRLVDPSWTVPPYDPELARQKLAEGGYPDGFPVTMKLFTQLGTRTIEMGEAVAGFWEAIGITVTRERTDQTQMRPHFQASNDPEGNSQTDGWAWFFCSPHQPSPELALGNAWRPEGNNKQAFSPAISEAYPRMLAEPNDDVRYEMAREVIQALRDDVHPINVLVFHQAWGISDKVGEWHPLPGLDRLNSLETVTPRNP